MCVFFISSEIGAKVNDKRIVWTEIWGDLYDYEDKFEIWNPKSEIRNPKFWNPIFIIAPEGIGIDSETGTSNYLLYQRSLN